MKRIIRARLKTNYLSPAYYSDIYTLTKTPNTIENIFKYNPDVIENKKSARFLQVCTDCRNPSRFTDAHTN